MYDELSRIESQYGSVAEYNRVMHEEDGYPEFLSEEEQKRRALSYQNELAEYKRKVDALNIKPSSLAVKIREQYNADCQKLTDKKKSGILSYNDYVYAGYDLRDELFKTAIPQIEEHYSIEFKPSSLADKTEPGKFEISYDKNNNGLIEYFVADNLDKDKFMQIYADMREIVGYSTHFTYYDTKYHKPNVLTGRINNANTVSGLNIGEIRYSYFDQWGVPNQDAHDILNSLKQPEESNRMSAAKSKLYDAMKSYDDIGDAGDSFDEPNIV